MATNSDEEGARSFSRFFETLGQGYAEQEASKMLHAVLKACEEEASASGKEAKGSLTIKILFQVDENGQVLAAHQVTKVDPKPARTKTVGFLTKGGNFTTQNPRQQSLPLREVTIKTNVRDLDEAVAR